MCGRFTLLTPLDELRVLFGFSERPNLRQRANIAPTQEVLALRAGPAGEQGEALRCFFPRWGLVPSWARDRSMAAGMINARAETLQEKPAFREAFRRRRCLVPADGFYEWRAEAGGRKQPFRIARPDGGPFAFAGLWESWRDPAQPEAPPLETCTLITTEANATLRPLHHRMPVILDPADHSLWLSAQVDAAALRTLLRPAAEALLGFHPVSTLVNDVRNERPELVEPVTLAPPPPPPEPRQASLF